VGLSGRVPSRVDEATKADLLALLDAATDAGWSWRAACQELELGEVRAYRWAERREVGELADRRPGGNPAHGLLDEEVAAIVALYHEWGEVDRSHRKLAHRGSYTDCVWVAPSTVRRVLAAHFTRAKVAVTVVEDLVSRKWIADIVSAEETSNQVEIVFTDALAAEGLLVHVEARADGLVDPTVDAESGPILLAVSDNGPQMTSGSNREFMALCAIAQHLGRPGTPTDQAWIESFFGHLKNENPHLLAIEDPAVLRAELDSLRTHYNGVRLHAGIGYVCPNDEHEGRGQAIRKAREAGLEEARLRRLAYHRSQRPAAPLRRPCDVV
jgi:putative transposase